MSTREAYYIPERVRCTVCGWAESLLDGCRYTAHWCNGENHSRACVVEDRVLIFRTITPRSRIRANQGKRR